MAGPSDKIEISYEQLSTGKFIKNGNDLSISTTDLWGETETVLLKNYFLTSPDLVTAKGSTLKGNIVNLLAVDSHPLDQEYVAFEDPQAIGKITIADGPVVVQRQDKFIELNAGDFIYLNDIVESKAGSVGIAFADQSSISIDPNATMVIDDFVYDPEEPTTGSMNANIITGNFSFVSGQIAKTGNDAMKVTTPVLTIGVRGTQVAGKANQDGEDNEIVLLPNEDGSVGQVLITNQSGSVLLTEAYQLTTIATALQPPTVPVIIPKEIVLKKFAKTIATTKKTEKKAEVERQTEEAAKDKAEAEEEKEDLEEEKEELEEEVEELEEEKEELEEQKEELEEEAEELEEAKEELEEEKEELEEAKEELQEEAEELEEAKEELEEVKEELVEEKEEIEEKEEELVEEVEQLEEKLQDRRIDDKEREKIEKELEKIEEEIEEVIEEKIEIEEKFEEVEKEVLEVEKKVEEVFEEVEQVEQKVEEVIQEVEQVVEQEQVIEQRVEQVIEQEQFIEQKVEEVIEQVEFVEQKVEVVQEKIEVVEQRFEVIVEEFEAFQEQFIQEFKEFIPEEEIQAFIEEAPEELIQEFQENVIEELEKEREIIRNDNENLEEEVFEEEFNEEEIEDIFAEEAVQEKLEEINEKHEQLEEQAEQLMEKDMELQQEVQELEQEAQELDQEAQELEAEARALEVEAERAYREGDQEAIQEIEEQFQELDQQWEELDENYQELDQGFQEVDQQYDQLDEQFEEINEQHFDLDNEVMEMLEEIDAPILRIEPDANVPEAQLDANGLGFNENDDVFAVEEENQINNIDVDAFIQEEKQNAIENNQFAQEADDFFNNDEVVVNQDIDDRIVDMVVINAQNIDEFIDGAGAGINNADDFYAQDDQADDYFNVVDHNEQLHNDQLQADDWFDAWIEDLAQEQNINVAPWLDMPNDITGNENIAVGTTLGYVYGSDANNDPLTFSILSDPSGNIGIDGNRLYLARAISITEDVTFNVLLKVEDPYGASDVDEWQVTVENNHSPVFAPTSTVSLAEDVSTGTTVSTISAADQELETMTYSITAGNDAGKFTINSSTGVITTAAALDYETTTSYTLTVTATDSFGNASTTTQTVNVTDVNEVVESIAEYTYKKNIGVHFTDDGTNQAGGEQVAPVMASFVENLGHTATQMNSFTYNGTNGTLDGIDLLWVTESWAANNSDIFRQAVNSSSSPIIEWIEDGGVAIMHDRHNSYSNLVMQTTTTDPTRSGTQDSDDVTFASLTNLITNGPAGRMYNSVADAISNSGYTLDGGSSSTHGRTLITSLPTNSNVTVYDDDQNTNYATDFWYGYGSGYVYYSHVPLDCYIGGNCDTDNSNDNRANQEYRGIWDLGSDVYSQNLLHYMVNETIFTSQDKHKYKGTAQDDIINGSHAADILFGRDGADTMWGGDGADDFLYTQTYQTDPGSHDTIKDFDSSEDRIDISAITNGASISRTISNGTRFKLDTNNDGTYEMEFELTGYTGTADDVTVVV